MNQAKVGFSSYEVDILLNGCLYSECLYTVPNCIINFHHKAKFWLEGYID